MIKKICYIITIINILFQIVYVTLGKYTTTELGKFIYVFDIFRAEYMIISGIIALFVMCALLILIIKTIKKICFLDIIVLLLNIEYIIYYFSFLTKQ